MKQTAALALAVATLVAVAACGDGSGAAEPDLKVEDIDLSVKVTLPHEDYFPTLEQELDIQRARDLAIQKCALRYGVEIKVPERHLPKVDMVREYPFEKVYPREVVEKWGFHLAPDNPLKFSPRPPDPEPPEDEKIVSFAVGQDSFRGKRLPEGGCSGEAERILGKGDPKSDDNHLGEDLRASGIRASRTDSRHRQMIEDWSRCMRKAGYRYPDPDKMLFDRRWRLRDTDTPQPGEVQAALADWECKKKVNYLGFMVALHTAYQKRFISERAEELRQYKVGLDILIENAGDVLGSKKR